MTGSDTPPPGRSSNWLEEALHEGVRINACMRVVCTTCGGEFMRALLLGPRSSYEANPSLTMQRAREMAIALADISPSPRSQLSHEFVEGVRSVLYGIWLQFGQIAHDEIFPALNGSWAEVALADMKRHYSRRMEAHRQHEERQRVKKRDWKD